MSSIVTFACNSFRLTIDLLRAGNTIREMWHDKDKRTFDRIIDVALRAIETLIFGYENKAKFYDESSETIKTCIVLRGAARALALPFSTSKVNALSTIVAYMSMTTEYGYYDQKKYLEMSPAELANIQLPVYGKAKKENLVQIVGGIPFALDETDEVQIVGYRPVDLQECRNELASAQKTSMIFSIFELLLKKTDLVDSIYDMYNFEPISEIPEAWYSDAVFSRYNCVITQAPIRNPVADPNGVQLYEKAAIIKWLRDRGTSPMTRRPTHESNLLPRPHLRALIDHRLAFQKEYNGTRLQDPPNQELQERADQENPSY